MSSLGLDRFIFVGQVFGFMGYAIVAQLACRCIRAFYSQLKGHRRNDQRRRVLVLGATFSTLFLALSTVSFCSQLVLDVEIYVDGDDTSIDFAGNLACILMVLLADGLLLWRVFIVWNKTYLILVLPTLLFTGVAGMSMAYMYGVVHRDVSPFDGTTIYLTYGALAIADNTLLTSLIVGRMFWFSRRNKITFSGGSSSNRVYLSVASMIVESALPYTISTIAFVIVYSQSPAASNALFPVVAQIDALSPLLILWRQASGRAVGGTSVPRSEPQGHESCNTALTAVQFNMRPEAQSSDGSTQDHTVGRSKPFVLVASSEQV